MDTPALTTATLDEHVFNFLERQGSWTEEEYLSLTDPTKRLVDFSDGFLEILPLPTSDHQLTLITLLVAFREALGPLGGVVLIAPFRLRVRPRKFREPDLLLLLSAADGRVGNRFWTGADLVLEIVSEDNLRRDLVDKRRDYAQAKVPEYWIVNPRSQKIVVLVLNKSRYRRLGSYGRGSLARPVVLPGFQISVDAVLDGR